MGGLSDILFAIFAEYFRGLFSSLQGFLVLHKIDNPPISNIRTEQSRQNQKSTNSPQTVLETRRQQELEKRCCKPPPTVQINKISTPKRIFRCVTTNIGAVFLVLSITYFVTFAGRDTLLSSFINWLGSFVLIPILIIVRLLSILWFADVAGAALRFRGHTNQKIPDFARAISDFVHAIVVELVFLLQALFFFNLNLPIISTSLGFIYMALLNSLYSFDYIWMSNGVTLNSRIALIERCWPFHLGFGTILTIATSYSSNFIISGCIFGALFPFFIVSSCLVEKEVFSSALKENNKFIFPAIPFYFIAQNITNKLSIAIFGRFF